MELLRDLAPAVPREMTREMTVVVLCDRGWHPYMRYPKNVAFCAESGRRLPARAFVPRPDTAWIGRGTAFSTAAAQRRCTLLAVWYPVWYVEQEEPWIILTDLPPDEVGVSWYALRFWIELGFKPALGPDRGRSRAWDGNGIRPVEPARRGFRGIGWCWRWRRC